MKRLYIFMIMIVLLCGCSFEDRLANYDKAKEFKHYLVSGQGDNWAVDNISFRIYPSGHIKFFDGEFSVLDYTDNIRFEIYQMSDNQKRYIENLSLLSLEVTLYSYKYEDVKEYLTVDYDKAVYASVIFEDQENREVITNLDIVNVKE